MRSVAGVAARVDDDVLPLGAQRDMSPRPPIMRCSAALRFKRMANLCDGQVRVALRELDEECVGVFFPVAAGFVGAKLG